MFVTRKEMSNIERRAALKELLKIIDVVETGKNELNEAIELTEIEDLEDALQAVCAKKHNSEFIVTRDLSGFKYSPIKAISPAEFIKKFG
jgi:predicted nucleic acid-binding protein